MRTIAMASIGMFGVLIQGFICAAAEPPRPAEAIRPLAVGARVPKVTLRSVRGPAVSLRAEAAKQPLVLIFYRGGWCPYCTLHLAELEKVEGKLRGMGLRIVAISPDRPEELEKSANKEALSYTLLSDASMEAARAFGVAFRVDDATVEQYKGHGIDLEAASGETHHLLPVPAVFIVGTDGRVKFAYANPDYKVRLSTVELLDAARKAVTP